MPYANRTNTLDRSQEHDLGLSPCEETRLQAEFTPALRALCTGKPVVGLWNEVSGAVRERTRLGSRMPHSLLIPTNLPLCAPARIDVAATQKRDATVAGQRRLFGGHTDISFIELLRNRMVAYQMGATRLGGLVGNVTIPKQTVGATAYWLATETTGITEGSQTFAQLPLTPRTVGAYTQISRLLQLQSSPDAQNLVLRDLAEQVAVEADRVVLCGTGTEMPQGIIGTASVGSFNGSSLDAAALLNAQVDVASANALTPTCGATSRRPPWRRC